MMMPAAEPADVVLYHARPPVTPAPLYTASAATALRQVIAVNTSGRDAVLDLEVVRHDGQPGDSRAYRLARSLRLGPHRAVPLIGVTAQGYVHMSAGDTLQGCQSAKGAIQLLAYGDPG